MKQGNNRRSRSRGNGKRYPNQRGSVFESNGPEVKVRGTAHQVLEKYLALARDAHSAGDRISAEGYYQFAEHYFRVINSDSDSSQSSGPSNFVNSQEGQQGRRSKGRNNNKQKMTQSDTNGESTKKSAVPESEEGNLTDTHSIHDISQDGQESFPSKRGGDDSSKLKKPVSGGEKIKGSQIADQDAEEPGSQTVSPEG